MFILIDNIVTDIVYLIFQEVSGPDHLGQETVHYNKIGLSWNLGIQFLFNRLGICPYCYNVHENIIVSHYVLVNWK